MSQYSLTPAEIHQEVGKWAAYEREVPTFWNEPTILDKTIPVLVAAIADIACRQLFAPGQFHPR
jgi:hypothetical protein